MNIDKLEESIYSLLIQTGATMAVAESLTGGEISSRITNIPGSSDYFLCGICAYANSAKVNLLGVKEGTLMSYGAVSYECATEMLQGVLKATGAKYGIATTGIAGPTGATSTKPIGLVYIAVGSADHYICEDYNFKGSRMEVKEQAVQKGLELFLSFFSGRNN